MNPKQILREISHRYPQAWQHVKLFRASKGKDLPDWPDWCYVPIAAGVAIVENGIGDNFHDALFNRLSPAIITAAAAWRVSQGIYRFDPDLYSALVIQPMDGNLPCEALKRLPEWCVYVETIPPANVQPGKEYTIGFWAHLEHDVNTGRAELRFVFFWNTGILTPVPIHLGDWTLKEGVRRVIDEARAVSKQYGIEIPNGLEDVADLTPYVQLVLYLCAENADMPAIRHPNTRVRMSGQVDVAREPRIWTVGERVGAAIRAHRNRQTVYEYKGGTHASPRPHVRRAHWHHFWTGARDGERKLVVHWLPPIPVGANEELPVVIHKVRKEEKN